MSDISYCYTGCCCFNRTQHWGKNVVLQRMRKAIMLYKSCWRHIYMGLTFQQKCWIYNIYLYIFQYIYIGKPQRRHIPLHRFALQQNIVYNKYCSKQRQILVETKANIALILRVWWCRYLVEQGGGRFCLEN